MIIKSEIDQLPNALDRMEEINAAMNGRKPALFLDYDGTLSPIVANPQDATMPEETKAILKKLSTLVPIAILSGRDRQDVAQKIGLEQLVYGGSHGYDIAGLPLGKKRYQGTEMVFPALSEAEQELREKLEDIEGVEIERKRYAIAVHYRNVHPDKIHSINNVVKQTVDRQDLLKIAGGKKVVELKPIFDWHKGKALLWLLDSLDLKSEKYFPIFIGDDITDEDALVEVAKEGTGIGIIVGSHGGNTAASYKFENLDEVVVFLKQILTLVQEMAHQQS